MIQKNNSCTSLTLKFANVVFSFVESRKSKSEMKAIIMINTVYFSSVVVVGKTEI